MHCASLILMGVLSWVCTTLRCSDVALLLLKFMCAGMPFHSYTIAFNHFCVVEKGAVSDLVESLWSLAETESEKTGLKFEFLPQVLATGNMKLTCRDLSVCAFVPICSPTSFSMRIDQQY